ncbi:MAG TPA: diphthamide synthesis protein [Candidatus Nanoarchaeia archaeon]|nr:diphthamide synthesis protein [Candidatus Nanoarchaeia archaeon]
MNVLHIYAKSNVDIVLVVKKALPKLKGTIGLVSTIQHLHKLSEVCTLLQQQGHQAVILGQVLGCQVPKGKPVDTLLYIGTGAFHPMGVFLKFHVPIVVADPATEKVTVLSSKDMEKYLRRRKANITRFLNADTVGFLLSAKSGQNFIERHNLFREAKELRKRFPEKQYYFFAANTLDFSQIDNFPFVDVWVNCSCPRLEDDAEQFQKGLVNVAELRELKL